MDRTNGILRFDVKKAQKNGSWVGSYSVRYFSLLQLHHVYNLIPHFQRVGWSGLGRDNMAWSKSSPSPGTMHVNILKHITFTLPISLNQCYICLGKFRWGLQLHSYKDKYCVACACLHHYQEKRSVLVNAFHFSAIFLVCMNTNRVHRANIIRPKKKCQTRRETRYILHTQHFSFVFMNFRTPKFGRRSHSRF